MIQVLHFRDRQGYKTRKMKSALLALLDAINESMAVAEVQTERKEGRLARPQ